MKPFALFLGVLFGWLLGLGRGWQSIAVSLISLAIALTLLKGRQVRIILFVSIVVSLACALLLRFLPVPRGHDVFQGIVEKCGDNYFLLKVGFRSYYVSMKGHGYEVGDILKVYGAAKEVRFTEYESRFSFGEYLKNSGVVAEIGSSKITVIVSNHLRIRAWENRFLQAFNPEAKALLGALLFARKDYQSELIVLADSLNVLFLLSGLGLFYSFSLSLLQKFLEAKGVKHPAEWTFVASILLLPFHFFKIGVIRCFFMRGLKLLDGHFLHQDLDYLSRLSIVGLILLLKPYRVLDNGFLVSFGIAFFLYVSSSLLRDDKPILAKLKSFAFIQSFLLPLSLAQGKAHVFSFLFVLLLYPLTMLLMAVGWLSFFTVPFTALFNPLADGIIVILKSLKSVDVVLPMPGLSVLGVGLFYGIYFLVIYLSQARFYRFRNGAIIFGVSIHLASLIPLVPLLTKSVTFVNVGQGDCTLIQDGFTTVLIDTGGVTSFDMAEEALIPYFHKRRIYKIDALIASHQDYDHVGAVSSLRKNFPVGRYVTEHESFPLRVGNLTFYNHNHLTHGEENDISLVLSLTFMGEKWLFTGDAPSYIEKNIIADYPDLDIDILKVGHHGSSSSTCDAFLDAITPRLAIISCGYGNRYGHPNSDVLKRLYARHIEVRRTDLEGTIVLSKPFWV